MPSGSPMSVANSTLRQASFSVVGKRAAIDSTTGFLLLQDFPKSPRSASFI